MRTWMFAVIVAAGFSAGCHSTSPLEYCENFESEVCVRVFQCWDAATQASSDFQTHYGTSVTECQTRLKNKNCAPVTNDSPCAMAGQTYHSDKADACVADLKATSCDSITGANGMKFDSPNCDTVCS